MFPPFPVEKAREVCDHIFSSLEAGRLTLKQVSAPSSERDGHGVMIGVLVCKDNNAHKVILKVVSGNSLVPDTENSGYENFSAEMKELWVPPIATADDISAALAPNDRRIHELTEKLHSATTDTDRRKLSAERSSLTTESLARVHGLYNFHTAAGNVLPLSQICRGKLPPTGTGDCCAPKLLDYAFAHGLLPVSMDEFYYGKDSDTKKNGISYPPCDKRCALVLPAMLGLEIIYRDNDIIVVNKQSGLLSVPGIGEAKQDCVAARVRRLFPKCIPQPSVHRLDMETSGLMVLAFNAQSHRNLSMQFQNGQVHKKYTALLDGSLAEATGLAVPSPDMTHGEMTLYFRLDIDNRPHQIWDEVHGKKSITEWERLGFEWYVCDDGKPRKVTRVLYTPHTGRTHQLRLASSDSHGFALPIVGDTLYNDRYKNMQQKILSEGENISGERLCLHANYLCFAHPVTGKQMEFTSKVPF